MFDKCYEFQVEFSNKGPSSVEFIEEIKKVIGEDDLSTFISHEEKGLNDYFKKEVLKFSVRGGLESISYFYGTEMISAAITGCDKIIDEKQLNKIFQSFLNQPYLIHAYLIDVGYLLYQNDMDLDEAILDRLDGISGFEEDYYIPEVRESEIYSDGLKEPPYSIIWRDSEWEYDISQNPGYWDHHGEYREEIAAHMWLGREFFELTGASREAVLATDWLEITELDNGVLELVAWPHPFNSDQGEQRRRQFALRNLLFPDAVAARRTLNIKQRERLRDLLEEMAGDPEARQSEILRRHVESLSPDKDPMKTVFGSDRFKDVNGKIDLDAAVAYIFRNKPLDVK